jgi:hypothetical protein
VQALAAALATHPWLRSAHDPFSVRRAVFAAARTAQAVKLNAAAKGTYGEVLAMLSDYR